MNGRSDSKEGRGPCPLVNGVRGGRLQTRILKGVSDPLGLGGALQIWDPNFRGLFNDGITNQNGKRRHRLRHFIRENALTHPEVDESGRRRMVQYFFGNVEVAIRRSILQHDTNERNSEGAHALKTELEELIRDEYGDHLWKPEQKIRVAIVPHDLEPDMVLIKIGRGIDIPAVDDQPVADVMVTVIDGNGEERPVRLPTWKYYDGRPGHLRHIEKPCSIYPGAAHFMAASLDELASVVIPAWGNGEADEVVRVGIDLYRKIGLAESYNGQQKEVAPEQPEPGVEVYRFEQPGLSPIPGCKPPSLVITLRQRMAVVTAPAPIVVPEISMAEAAPQKLEPRPTPPAYEEEPTIVVGPRPGVATSRLGLEVVAIALSKVEVGSRVSYWCLQIDGDGNIVRDKDGGADVLRIGASSDKPKLSVNLPGQSGWPQVNAPTNLPLANGGSMEITAVPQTLADIYEGFLCLVTPITLTLPSGRQTFGRVGKTVDHKLAIGLLTQPDSLKVDGAPSSNFLECLGLSRDHLVLSVEGNAIQTEMLEGQTPAWRLNADLEVEEELSPGAEGFLTLAEDDHLVVGPYVLRTIRI